MKTWSDEVRFSPNSSVKSFPSVSEWGLVGRQVLTELFRIK